jgi:RpiB/LacA/LacB family sugar-phosphate isomerase
MKRYNLLVPLAGKGQRMINGGYTVPKPLILAGDRHIIDYSLGSIDITNCNLIFVVRRDHICNYAIDKVLQSKYGKDITIVISEEDTDGSVSSCYLAKDIINNDIPLIVFCPDIYFEPKFVPTDEIFKDDGLILTFKANSTNYSYVQHDENNVVTKTAEKIVISDNASVGVYCFKTGRTFLQLAEIAVNTRLANAKDEHYICPLYNMLIAKGGVVRIKQVPLMYIMGTPDEMTFFKNVIFPYFLQRSFILCSDHSGFELKESAKKIIEELNINYMDCGCYSADDCDYDDYVSQAVETKKYFPGAIVLGFCRSGQGVNICANKHKDIRGALITTPQAASLGIRHNAANFFAVAAENTTENAIREIIQILMVEKFEGGRHQNRLQKRYINDRLKH